MSFFDMPSVLCSCAFVFQSFNKLVSFSVIFKGFYSR